MYAYNIVHYWKENQVHSFYEDKFVDRWYDHHQLLHWLGLAYLKFSMHFRGVHCVAYQVKNVNGQRKQEIEYYLVFVRCKSSCYIDQQSDLDYILWSRWMNEWILWKGQVLSFKQHLLMFIHSHLWLDFVWKSRSKIRQLLFSYKKTHKLRSLEAKR